jgi:catechol 2,3-dioxygenase-like lactoylglutathione lyase family enzyme
VRVRNEFLRLKGRKHGGNKTAERKPASAKPQARPTPAGAKAATPRAAAAKTAAPLPSSIVFATTPKSHVPPKPLATGAFALDKLHQVALTATNLDLAVEFYRDVLGLKFLARFDPPGLAFFALSGGARLLLSATASQASLYFLVGSLDTAVRELKKRGVSFLQPPAMIHRDEAGNFARKGSEEWMVFLKDPSGNLLGLVERR